jgi:hypothetical protein
LPFSSTYPSWEIDVNPGDTPDPGFWNSTERMRSDYNGNVYATSTSSKPWRISRRWWRNEPSAKTDNWFGTITQIVLFYDLVSEFFCQ